MLIFAKLIGIIIVCTGTVILLTPKTMKQLIVFWRKGKRIYLAASLRILFGIVFLLSASLCRLVGVIVTVGILMLLGGMLIFILGLKRVKLVLDWWDKKPLAFVRLSGLLALLFGALIIYSL